jgi:N4-gp56 family major capsid protein
MTKLENLIDPEVMAPMISAKLTKAIKVTPFAKIDNTLQGRPGSTITVPKYVYIGDASDLAEGATAVPTTLTTTTAEYEIKKAVKQVELTDEAVLS